MKKILNFLMKIIKSKITISILFIIIIFLIAWYWPAVERKYNNGVTFSAKYTRELGLDPETVFRSAIDELGIKKFRLVAYWDQIEKNKDEYDFGDLDWQMKIAEEKKLEVILALGRRVPRYPECHIPNWVNNSDWENQKKELLVYIEDVVNRYKDSESIIYWQVENEPYLTTYVKEHCGGFLDADFLQQEVDLVKKLDPNRKVLLTDSGNLGLWLGPYKRGDVFGTTLYVYLANEKTGEIKSFVNHNYYKFKKTLASIFYGKKRTFQIETSIEPWLLKPITEVPVDIQLQSMNIDRAKEVLKMSAKTGFDEQYLWGVEWWYYLKENGKPELWDYLKTEVFNK